MSLRRLAPSAGTITSEAPVARTSRRRSRAKPRPPRPQAVILAELKGLGGLVHEQALMDAGAQPQVSLIEWTNRLAAELHTDGVESPATYRNLLMGIVAVNRRAREARPMDAAVAQGA